MSLQDISPVFILKSLTNHIDINVLFPFHIPIPVPRKLWNVLLDSLSYVRIMPRRQDSLSLHTTEDDDEQNGKAKPFVRLHFPMNFVTAPLIADLFLLAILAIGREEVSGGILGTDNISPIDIMAFFITLAYIAISIDASGLIRYLAFKVLQWGGKVGHRLFFFLYSFFFLLGSFIGNDPIILSGTAFLAYMTRVSSNIVHPRAWIHTQFAVANIASAILVSSNPTNLVLAGAFNIRFINYTANMIVPVAVTAIVLFPFLLYVVFANEALIPESINIHELPEEAKAKKPVNPNIPHARGHMEEEEYEPGHEEQTQLLSLEEIMNPFLDKGGAIFGAVIMAATLITVLVLNAVSAGTHERPVFWVTVPAAFVMFCWDLGFGWYHREETRQIARRGRLEVQTVRAERALREEGPDRAWRNDEAGATQSYELATKVTSDGQDHNDGGVPNRLDESSDEQQQRRSTMPPPPAILISENTDDTAIMTSSSSSESGHLDDIADPVNSKDPATPPAEKSEMVKDAEIARATSASPTPGIFVSSSSGELDDKRRPSRELSFQHEKGRTTLVSLARDGLRWLQETFPTAAAVALHLPFALIPFAFSMFVLVQALVTKGWIPVFAYGWDHWVRRTGTVGAIGGMGFLSVVLCNVSLSDISGRGPLGSY